MARPAKPRATSVVDDMDAITPCPPTQDSPPSGPLCLPGPVHEFGSTRSVSLCSECDVAGLAHTGAVDSGRRRDSVKALEQGTDGDPERLWKRMLALQQIYGCYNSARMSAALSSGEFSLLLHKAEQAVGNWRSTVEENSRYKKIIPG
ncbi:hypothetical protein DL764_000042 [Monosporascus ibericus]|uniref:Uncharacterized protein n=1 Tax=Monosporascus ibericus TaxID=155417 RepID=A0A4Q4TWX4_9PEZI|nr:hypothetical protein DL764_000042 [Monosporascus ibericus]